MVFYKIHKLNKSGYLVTVACIKRSYFLKSHITYVTRTVCRAINCGIVYKHQFTVTCHPYVGFNLINTKCKRLFKGFHSVFGIFAFPTPVRRNENIVFALCPVIHNIISFGF